MNRGSRVRAGQLLAVLENRDLAAVEAENKGSYQQAEANYHIETSSALPEEWQKAEYDLKAAKENYDAAQKVYDSRKQLFQEGALPRKDFDQSTVALTAAKVTVRNRLHAHGGTAIGRQEGAAELRARTTRFGESQIRRSSGTTWLLGGSQPD